jgi:PKD repeat protein
MVGMYRRRAVAWIGAVVVTSSLVAVPATAATTAEIVNDNPSNWTPDVLDGRVEAIARVGESILIGGTFTQVQDDVTTYSRTSIAAFDASTGVVDSAFDPVLDGDVTAIVPAADGTSVYITGNFNNVNGTLERKVARIDVATGSLVPGFDSALILSEVRDARLVGDQLIIGGPFDEVGTQPRPAIASLDAATGEVTPFVDLGFAGVHNGGATLVAKMEVTPDGDRLLVIGNFTSVEGVPRDQIAMLDLTGPTAALANWYTPFFESTCASVFNTFMRDLDIDATGTFAIVSTTGAYRGGIGAGTSCDTISRWELDQAGTDLEATWVNYTGGDTTYAVEIGPGVVYAGGHMRWVNNPYDGDYAGPGAIPREGIVALDTVNGMPFSWDPGRARGVGVFDMLLTDEGLWAGSDTDRWGNETHRKLALFPAFNGTAVEDYAAGSLPNHVEALGRITAPGTPDPSVLYRVNAGGPALASADDGPDWEGDIDSASAYRNSGSNRAVNHSIHFIEAAVPSDDFDRVPLDVYATERWDPASGEEMAWTFSVPFGTPVEVRLYLGNKCACTDEPGERVFDVVLEDATVIDDLDLSLMHGHETATMYSFDIVSDGAVNIEFGHVVENPLINAIEIIRTDTPGGGSIAADDDVLRRFLDPTTGPGGAQTTAGTEAWRWARGGFMVNDTVYTGHADGTMWMRSHDGDDWGQPARVELYGSTFMPAMADVTGMFFDPVDYRVYYTLAGDSTLYWRWFTPESSLVGATAFTATGDVGALGPARVRGMFLADGWIYFADSAGGDLLRIGFDGGVVDGPVTTVDSSADWRARALIVSTNQAPTAAATADCAYRQCDFDATGSSDPDGGIVAYDWDFGDGATSTGATASHTYADLGSATVTLTVTDDEGLTDTTTIDVIATNAPPDAAFTLECDFLTCEFDATDSSDSDGDVVTYQWNFGDGGSGSGELVTHTYTTTAIHPVTLTVTDDDGGTGTTTVDVAVTPPPVHIHLLRPRPYDVDNDKWIARAIVKMKDANGDFVEGVEVTVRYGSQRFRSCTTNANGKCKVRIWVKDTRAKIPLEVVKVAWSGGYDPAANLDFDKDGNSERTVVIRPF